HLIPVPILEAGKRCGVINSNRDGIGVGEPGDPMFSLQAGAQHAVALNMQVATRHKSLGERTGLGIGGPYDPAFTLQRDHEHAVIHGMSVRRLTPRECERLQGFPDDYTLITYRNKPAADGPRYRALGNSMAVPVMAWIARRIETVESILSKEA